jgi:hypothetical protein
MTYQALEAMASTSYPVSSAEPDYVQTGTDYAEYRQYLEQIGGTGEEEINVDDDGPFLDLANGTSADYS